MNRLKIFALIMAVGMITSCASVLNPYDSEFNCPEGDWGKCTSMDEAYRESVEGSWGYSPAEQECGEECPDGGIDGENAPQRIPLSKQAHVEYQVAKYKRLTKELRSPEPIELLPPEKIRMLLMSYTDEENSLMGGRYIHFYIDQPAWINNNPSK